MIPPPPPPAPVDDAQRRIDTDHLNLLAIFHLIWGLFSALGIAGLFAHYAFMQMVLRHFPAGIKFPAPSTPGELKLPPLPQGNPVPFPTEFFNSFLHIFYIIAGAGLAACTLLNLLSWRNLKGRRSRTLTFVTAGLNCLFVPLGTVLGIFTFIVLQRPSVRSLYDQTPR